MLYDKLLKEILITNSESNSKLNKKYPMHYNNWLERVRWEAWHSLECRRHLVLQIL